MDPKTELLRHTLATIAYRAAKCLRDVPQGFSTFLIAPGSRTPGDILAHMCDLLDWALHLAQGIHRWHDSKPANWEQDSARFFAALAALDGCLAGPDSISATPEKLFQGPIADALTHLGQIAYLRRLAASPVRGENYHKAHIEAGHVGTEQPKPVYEF